MDIEDRAFIRTQVAQIRRATMNLEYGTLVRGKDDINSDDIMRCVGQMEQALGLIVGRIEGTGNHNQMSLGLLVSGKV